MTLNIMLVGKFHDKITNSFDATVDFYKNDDQDDPNILTINRLCEVCEISKI